MLKYIGFMFFLASSYEAVSATQAQMILDAQNSAKQSAGQIQMESPASNFNIEEQYENLGIEEQTSTGSMLSTSASISSKLSASKEFACRDGKSLYLAYLKIKFSECNIATSKFNISYCSSTDSRDCPAAKLKHATLTQNIPSNFNTDDSIELSDCLGNRCKLKVIHTPKDDFNGDLEAEAESRDSAESSLGTAAALSNINSPYFDEFKNEAGDTASYMNNAMEELETSGEMPIYRNSDSDKALFGDRAGSILIDAASMANGEICTQDSSSLATQTCNNTFNATEFVCDEPPAICTYERVESIVQDCGRKLTATCTKDANCSTVNYFDYTGNTMPSLAAQNSLVIANRNYVIQGANAIFPTPSQTQSDFYLRLNDLGSGRFQVKSGKRFSYDDNPYRRTFEFELQIKDINELDSFIYEATQHEDFFTVLVNNTPVYTFPTVRGIACYPWRDLARQNAGRLGTLLRATCSNRSTDFSDRGRWRDQAESNQSPNIDLKPYMQTGSNKILMILGVIGGGHINSTFKANYSSVCDCSWAESWEALPCAL